MLLSMHSVRRLSSSLLLCASLALLVAAKPATQPQGGGGAGVLTAAAFTSAARLLAPGGVSLTNLSVVRAPDASTTVTGMLNGASFLLRFPAAWNHELVLFAHGYVTPGTPHALDVFYPNQFDKATQGVLATAFAQRYAYGYSSYIKEGYAVHSGIADTELLKRLVNYADSVSRAWVVGESMGGNVVIGLVEQYPGEYAGALPYCGVVAGWYQEIRYLTDVRVVYDYYTKPLGAPLALPGAGHAETPDPNLTLNAVIGSVGALFGQAASKPAYAAIIANIARVTGANPDPISFLTALAGNTYGQSDYLATTGGNGYSNIGKTYQGSSNDAALNGGVERVAATPAATAYLNANYTPTGRFTTKVLSLHNLIDPLVPYQQEPLLKARVAAAGNSANLVQQVVDPKPINLADIANSGPAHCYFTPSQLTYAWNELRGWTLQGVRPTDGVNITQR